MLLMMLSITKIKMVVMKIFRTRIIIGYDVVINHYDHIFFHYNSYGIDNNDIYHLI